MYLSIYAYCAQPDIDLGIWADASNVFDYVAVAISSCMILSVVLVFSKYAFKYVYQ